MILYFYITHKADYYYVHQNQKYPCCVSKKIKNHQNEKNEEGKKLNRKTDFVVCANMCKKTTREKDNI